MRRFLIGELAQYCHARAENNEFRLLFADDQLVAWHLGTGEERSVRIPNRSLSPVECYKWLVWYGPMNSWQNQVLVWNYKKNVSYVIDLQNTGRVKYTSWNLRVHPTKDVFIGFSMDHCRRTCFDQTKTCGAHKEDEITIISTCAMFSMTDGALLTQQNVSKTFKLLKYVSFDRQITPHFSSYTILKNRNLLASVSFDDQVTPFNRQGSYTWSVIGIERKLTSNARSEKVLEEGNSPVLVTMCQYDLDSDKLSVREYGGIVPRSSMDSLSDLSLNPFPWKDSIHLEQRRPTKRLALKLRLGKQERTRLMERSETDQGSGGFLLTMNDMYAVRVGKCDFFVEWYDQLAFDKARKVENTHVLGT